MTHWLCILNRENWKSVLDHQVWGVSERHRNTISRVTIGDGLFFYLVGEQSQSGRLESAVCGHADVASDVFRDIKRIFTSKTGETYPLRTRLQDVVSFGEIPFKPLIPDLSFIKNKKRWSGHLQGKAMRTLPERDVALIFKAAEK
ncbi:MAG: EVE domain-containing protein [Theionarchaea archaeon]|nr:EVE domain-containing protein [Theionarchaea archaeon]MBU7000146.1 EVE domain-containing protein [Theionarchaea archaeon]MBU7020863.1 EVE domain-containing protein [Theionarchaea archaeon]MBU7033901.1 EVE domain-containing protein [Theionarchaea archaeon]MBU7039196.1 EVE domain-containing protein [Theionarchaea archaeon]